MDALPGQAIEIRLHVIRGQPKTLQKAVAYVMRVDAVLESAAPKVPQRRAHVQQFEGETPKDDYMVKCTKQIESITAAFKALEKRLQELESNLKKEKNQGKVFQLWKAWTLLWAPKKLRNGEGHQDP